MKENIINAILYKIALINKGGILIMTTIISISIGVGLHYLPITKGNIIFLISEIVIKVVI